MVDKELLSRLTDFARSVKLPPDSTLTLNGEKNKLDGIPRKFKLKTHVFWYIVFHVLKVLLINNARYS